MIPIFDKIYQLIKSKYNYEKVFHYEFERTHHSVLTINYGHVFDEAHKEAIDAIWESAYKKAIDSLFGSPIHDSLYEEAYDLASESCSPEIDATDFEELVDSICKPHLDEKVDSALKNEIESAKNGPEFDKHFKKSVHSTFKGT